MKKIIIGVILATIILAGFVYWQRRESGEVSNSVPVVEIGQSSQTENGKKSVEVVAENLAIPWALTFLPDERLLITERAGKLKILGNEDITIQVAEVASVGESGLLGLTLHPNFAQNSWIYLYFTTRSDGQLKNVVARYTFSGTEISDKKIIIDNIPAGANHDGGRLAFGPDGMLYATTGDAGNANSAQDTKVLAGKILRVKDDGSLPEDNPFVNAIYSYGHRNVQGITWDEEGQLWATEHGRSGITSGYDELNLIKKGANYGWPEIQGSETRLGMEAPIIHSGSTKTWAPSGVTHFQGSIFFAGLRGQAIYEYKIKENKLIEHFKEEFGRLREIVQSPVGDFFTLTNNTDGRGTPKVGDDKILKLILTDSGVN